MSRSLRLPLAASLAGHAVVIALVALLAARLPPPLSVFAPKNAIQIILAPPPPPQPMAKPAPPPPPPVVETAPPPPPPAVKAEPPPPVPRPAPRRVVRRLPPRRLPTPEPQQAVPPPPPVQTAAIPRPPVPPRPAVPVVSAAYRGELSAWLEAHRHYPESAREQGEEGEALLRFKVARGGQVLSYAIVRSSGHPDLDAAIEAMMRGATLPPFPSDMPAPDIQVTVAVHFALAR